MIENAFPRISPNNNKIAIVDSVGSHTYHTMNSRIDRLAAGLLKDQQDLQEERIAFLIPASLDYVTVLIGIWRAGGIAVPINTASAELELKHFIESAGVTRLIASPDSHDKVRELCGNLRIQLLTVDDLVASECNRLPNVSLERSAMILFTSGTTSKPKGVLTSHNAIRAQILTLLEAWKWSNQDVIPLFLPLHHVHGIINVLSCALWSGATVHMMPKLDLDTICSDVISDTYSVFMAVPTIYVKLLDHLNNLDIDFARAVGDGFGRMRLNVSGSAACPINVFEQWKEQTGQILLERYGMTEVGMAISNSYAGERRAGFVGVPLPGVTVCLFDEFDRQVTEENTPGEIRIKGDNLFKGYWNNPKATNEAFKRGWFCSGDIAVVEDSYFRIMGRSSIDIIKSGGYKLSALEIEGVILTHENVSEAAVFGVPDDTWGESVVVCICLKAGTKLEYTDLKNWCVDKMSAYKIPKRMRVLDSLPRNAMGKVTKSMLKEKL